jgi:hypothetical protein
MAKELDRIGTSVYFCLLPVGVSPVAQAPIC